MGGRSSTHVIWVGPRSLSFLLPCDVGGASFLLPCDVGGASFLLPGGVRVGNEERQQHKGEVSDAATFKAHPPWPHCPGDLPSNLLWLQSHHLRVKGGFMVQGICSTLMNSWYIYIINTPNFLCNYHSYLEDYPLNYFLSYSVPSSSHRTRPASCGTLTNSSVSDSFVAIMGPSLWLPSTS